MFNFLIISFNLVLFIGDENPLPAVRPQAGFLEQLKIAKGGAVAACEEQYYCSEVANPPFCTNNFNYEF